MFSSLWQTLDTTCYIVLHATSSWKNVNMWIWWLVCSQKEQKQLNNKNPFDWTSWSAVSCMWRVELTHVNLSAIVILLHLLEWILVWCDLFMYSIRINTCLSRSFSLQNKLNCRSLTSIFFAYSIDSVHFLTSPNCTWRRVLVCTIFDRPLDIGASNSPFRRSPFSRPTSTKCALLASAGRVPASAKSILFKRKSTENDSCRIHFRSARARFASASRRRTAGHRGTGLHSPFSRRLSHTT